MATALSALGNSFLGRMKSWVFVSMVPGSKTRAWKKRFVIMQTVRSNIHKDSSCRL